MVICKHTTPLGDMLLAAGAGALTGAWFENAKYYAAGLEVGSRSDPDDPVLLRAGE